MRQLETVARKSLFFVVVAGIVGLTASVAMAHCEIPCGIYGDQMRVKMLREHFKTVEKSMRQIQALQHEDDINYNQLVRWVNNKEKHANKIQEIVYQYFMNQRVKPVEKGAEGHDGYVLQIELLHKMLVQAMKSKQTTTVKHVENLRNLLTEFETMYFEGHEKAVESGHHGKHDH